MTADANNASDFGAENPTDQPPRETNVERTSPTRAARRIRSATVVIAAIGLLAAAFHAGSIKATRSTADLLRARIYGQQVAWKPCTTDYLIEQPSTQFNVRKARCATVIVPAVYGVTTSYPDFGIAVIKVPATDPDKRLGTLFFNPGGPGGSGVEEVQWTELPSQIRERFDIVGFDPRGTNRSQPVSGQKIRCDDLSSYKANFLTPEATPVEDKEYEQNDKIWDKHYNDCAKANPQWWTIGTSQVVEDLNVLRSTVGRGEKLFFIGSSYGTTIAAEWLRRYPEHTARVVLDSPTDDQQEAWKQELEDSKSKEKYLTALLTGYAKSHDITLAQAKRRLFQVRFSADRNQLDGFAGTEPAQTAAGREQGLRQSSEQFLTCGITSLTYGSISYTQERFNTIFDWAYRDKWNGGFEYECLALWNYDGDGIYSAFQNRKPFSASLITRSGMDDVISMVRAVDRDGRDQTNGADSKKQWESLWRAAPTWMHLNNGPRSADEDWDWDPADDGTSWEWRPFTSAEIPDPPSTLPPRVNKTGSPVMVIGSEHESVTPYAFAQQTAKSLKSPLISWNGSEHAPLFAEGADCLRKFLVDYLINGKLPRTGATCSAKSTKSRQTP